MYKFKYHVSCTDGKISVRIYLILLILTFIYIFVLFSFFSINTVSLILYKSNIVHHKKQQPILICDIT